MKKLLCIILSVLMMVSVIALVSCRKTEKTLKFGMGVYSTASATSATATENGKGSGTFTAALITVDADNKIVACKLDTAQIKEAAYTADGKAVATDAAKFRTKREQGDEYDMNGKKWYEHADAFEAFVVGKTLDEVKSKLVSDTLKGTDDVIKAGCTIKINEFVAAIEKAFENLADSNATAASTLKLGMATEQKLTDYKAEDGINEVATTIFGAAVDANGKILAVDTDCVQVQFKFDATGTSTFDAAAPILSKRQKGNDYGMSNFGKTEWFAQADAFESLCIGKTAAEIAGLAAADGKGTDTVKKAGCTITVTGFTAAAAKIAK